MNYKNILVAFLLFGSPFLIIGCSETSEKSYLKNDEDPEEEHSPGYSTSLSYEETMQNLQASTSSEIDFEGIAKQARRLATALKQEAELCDDINAACKAENLEKRNEAGRKRSLEFGKRDYSTADKAFEAAVSPLVIEINNLMKKFNTKDYQAAMEITKKYPQLLQVLKANFLTKFLAYKEYQKNELSQAENKLRKSELATGGAIGSAKEGKKLEEEGGNAAVLAGAYRKAATQLEEITSAVEQ